MDSLNEAPPLPRSPSLIHDSPPNSPSPPTPPPELPAPLAAALPLPPRFPSMTDVTVTAEPVDPPAPLDVAWHRPRESSPPPAGNSPVVENGEEEKGEEDQKEDDASKKKSFVTKILDKVKALINKKKKPEQDKKETSVEKKPGAVDKIRKIACKLPDPTIVFIAEVALVLLIGKQEMDWKAKLAMKVTVAAILGFTWVLAVLWRGQKMEKYVEEPSYKSPYKTEANASKVVKRGEDLRKRLSAVEKREKELKEDGLKLEILRKEIEKRLPPQVSIAQLLEMDKQGSET